MKLSITIYDRIVLAIVYSEEEELYSASYFLDGKCYRMDEFKTFSDAAYGDVQSRTFFSHPAIESGELVLKENGDVNQDLSFNTSIGEPR